jgi:hypothetical protein
MAQSLQLSEAVRDGVADGIARSVPIVFPRSRQAEVELAESFELWEFQGVVTDPATDFISRTRFRQRYYHQILVDKEPAGYAVSDGTGSTLKVIKVVPSDVARALDAAIDGIEIAAPGDVRVRVLTAGAYYVTAFWIVDAERPLIKVICCPPFYKLIRRGEFLGPAEFVRMLAREHNEGRAGSRR